MSKNSANGHEARISRLEEAVDRIDSSFRREFDTFGSNLQQYLQPLVDGMKAHDIRLDNHAERISKSETDVGWLKSWGKPIALAGGGSGLVGAIIALIDHFFKK